MVRALKIKKEKGSEAKKYLQEKNWLDTSIMIGKSAQRYLLFPLTEKFDERLLLKKFPDAKIVERSLQKLEKKKGSLKDLLKGVIPDKYIDKVVRSYDVVGDIAIIEIPKGLERLEKSIAWTLKRTYPNIKVVAKKAGKVGEIYRLRKLEILTGEKRTETIHKEHGVIIKVDLAKAYFSPRYSGERLRIAKQVKPNEKVLVMFAGIGPFALVIAKEQPKCKIWAIELNPDAYKFMEENIRINRMGHIIKPILGDVREVVPKLKEKFDRIIMVLPESGFEFLDLAFKAAAEKAVAHFYLFSREDELSEKIEEIKKIGKKLNRKVKILRKVKAGAYAPRTQRWCIDFEIS